MPGEVIARDLNDSAIMFEVSCFQGGGYLVRLGSPTKGFKARAVAETYADVVQQLIAMVMAVYPESAFAKKHGSCKAPNAGHLNATRELTYAS